MRASGSAPPRNLRWRKGAILAPFVSTARVCEPRVRKRNLKKPESHVQVAVPRLVPDQPTCRTGRRSPKGPYRALNYSKVSGVVLTPPGR